jgi:hypothetical protein
MRKIMRWERTDGLKRDTDKGRNIFEWKELEP